MMFNNVVYNKLNRIEEFWVIWTTHPTHPSFIQYLLTNGEEQSAPYTLNYHDKTQKLVSIYTTGINNITLLRNQHK